MPGTSIFKRGGCSRNSKAFYKDKRKGLVCVEIVMQSLMDFTDLDSLDDLH